MVKRFMFFRARQYRRYADSVEARPYLWFGLLLVAAILRVQNVVEKVKLRRENAELQKTKLDVLRKFEQLDQRVKGLTAASARIGNLTPEQRAEIDRRIAQYQARKAAEAN
jgi:hypothetical protein